MTDEFEIRGYVLYRYNGNGENVIIPDSVHVIHEKAFRFCESVVSIEVPASVTWIEWGAFSFCPNLERLVLPASVDFISVSAIEGSQKLKTIIMEDNGKYYVKDNKIISVKDESYVISTDIIKSE